MISITTETSKVNEKLNLEYLALIFIRTFQALKTLSFGYSSAQKIEFMNIIQDSVSQRNELRPFNGLNLVPVNTPACYSLQGGSHD